MEQCGGLFCAHRGWAELCFRERALEVHLEENNPNYLAAGAVCREGG